MVNEKPTVPAIMLHKHELVSHILKQDFQMMMQGIEEEDRNRRLAYYYTDRCRVKYTRDQQDEMFQKLMDIMASGGTSWLIDSMDYMPEFTYYGNKCLGNPEKPKSEKTETLIKKKEALEK